jgi:uncharacterized phage-associated protein
MLNVESSEQVSEIKHAPIDPRSICNLMLDMASGRHPITNLALQKLLYFAHGIFLTEQKTPLVLGYFEAWEFGPVHPTAYMAFKSAGNRPIAFRAVRKDLLTGAEFPIFAPTDHQIIDCIQRVMLTYARMTPGRLVDISHARNAPWDFVANKARTSMAFGMRIPDNVIVERFRYHKVSIGPSPSIGEPSEDTPFT